MVLRLWFIPLMTRSLLKNYGLCCDYAIRQSDWFRFRNPHTISIIKENAKVPVLEALVQQVTPLLLWNLVVTHEYCNCSCSKSYFDGFCKAVEAGREAFLAGRMPRKQMQVHQKQVISLNNLFPRASSVVPLPSHITIFNFLKNLYYCKHPHSFTRMVSSQIYRG